MLTNKQPRTPSIYACSGRGTNKLDIVVLSYSICILHVCIFFIYNDIPSYVLLVLL